MVMFNYGFFRFVAFRCFNQVLIRFCICEYSIKEYFTISFCSNNPINFCNDFFRLLLDYSNNKTTERLVSA